MSLRTFSTRAAALALATIAVTLKLLFAPGLMPAVDLQGAPTLVICTAEGAKTIPDPAGQPHETQEACPFEGQAALLTAELPQPLQLAAVDYPAPALAWEAAVSPGEGLTAPPPPSTGPPLHNA